MDKEDSVTDIGLNRTISTALSHSLYYLSVDNLPTEDNPPKNPQEEMVNFFYKSMLKMLVSKVEVIVPDSVESISSGDCIFIRANANYKEACDDEEVLENEIETTSKVENVFESQNHIKTVPNKRRTASQRSFQSNDYVSSKANILALKREKRPRRRSNKTRKKNTSAPVGSMLVVPQVKYVLEDSDFEEYVVIKFKNGNIYMGPTYMKMFHGVGEYRWANGTIYKGDFFKGEITGSGKYIYTDLSTYEGEVYKGYRHGFGKYFLKHSTAAYSGNWYLGVRQGTGCINFDYNNWYDGSWKLDLMSGFGIRHYPSGTKYQGEFVEGKRHGNGFTLFWNNDIYKGNWEEGKRGGFGQYIWKPYHDILFCTPALNTYTGMWKDDYMHGRGELNLGTVNGCRYIGYFCYNQKHGGGLIINENGFVNKYNPMFAENRPVQYSDKTKPQSPKCDESLPRIPRTPDISTQWIPGVLENLALDGINAINEVMKIENNSNIGKKVFHIPNNLLNKHTRAKFNLCKYQFNRKTEKLRPINIPMWLPAENIDLNPFIQNLLEVIDEYDDLETSESIKTMPRSWKEVGVEMNPKPQVKYTYQEIYNIEEKALRRAIHINLRSLKSIYKHYSLVGCLKKLPYETLMNRLFLWQMYRDCKISEKGISLTSIDVLLAEGCVSFSESIHDPFENIYFWQFLTSLLQTAWEVYGSKTIKYIFEGRSILEQIFTQFLDEDIFPNAGHHIGCALFDYKDIISLKSAYNWYKSIEEPMTIKTFIINIFSLNKKESFSYEPIPEEFYLKSGTNISIGNDVVFLADEDPKYGIGPRKEKIIPNATKCNKKKLRFLHDLGTKIIYKKIRTVVPGIFTKHECFNHDYKLCFLEFYEILLLCTQTILKKNEYKLKKKIAKISELNDNVLLKAITTSSKKSKQYRKSASHHSIAKRHIS